MTPAQVRKALDISQSTMASWKSRDLTPNASTLIQLAEYFNTTPAYLMGNRLAREREPAQITINTTPDPEWAELEKKIRDGTITESELTRYKELLHQSSEAVERMRPQIEARFERIIEAQERQIALNSLLDKLESAEPNDVERLLKMIDAFLEPMPPTDTPTE